ncbi:MAG: hypothetical protein QOE75_2234 [Solirubrobacterales bacterium]|nr:hypothetical protein [Solirubrobacterales bacterium]
MRERVNRGTRCGLLVACVLALLGSAPPASGEVVQEGGVRISYDAALRPTALPEDGTAPATVTFGARLIPLRDEALPQLRKVTVGISRHGYLDSARLPVCQYRQLAATSTTTALRVCGRSLVGEGRFKARVLIPDQAPFPSAGRLLAFYGRYRGHPAVLAHVYGTDPAPTSYTIPFLLRRSRGTFGTTLSASLQPAIGESGYITLLRMTMGGRFGHLRASCPARPGATALFPLASLSIGFPRRQLSTTLLRSCRAR